MQDNPNLYKINQSKIKRLTTPLFCPKRYYGEEVSGEFRAAATPAMVKGQYFEWRAFGTPPKEGGIPHIPLLKATKNKPARPSTDQIRIDAQLERLPQILKDAGIKVIKTDFWLDTAIYGVSYHGTMDVLVEYKGMPYIMDTKLTADVTSTYGKFAWGSLTAELVPGPDGVYFVKHGSWQSQAMDLLQAHSYMYIMKERTKRKWGFLYAVFDYKPNSEHRIIEIEHSEAGQLDALSRLKGTKEKIFTMHSEGYPALPSASECADCPILNCASRLVQGEDTGKSLDWKKPQATTEPSSEDVF